MFKSTNLLIAAIAIAMSAVSLWGTASLQQQKGLSASEAIAHWSEKAEPARVAIGNWADREAYKLRVTAHNNMADMRNSMSELSAKLVSMVHHTAEETESKLAPEVSIRPNARPTTEQNQDAGTSLAPTTSLRPVARPFSAEKQETFDDALRDAVNGALKEAME